jgi:hypothetical protein
MAAIELQSWRTPPVSPLQDSTHAIRPEPLRGHPYSYATVQYSSSAGRGKRRWLRQLDGGPRFLSMGHGSVGGRCEGNRGSPGSASVWVLALGHAKGHAYMQAGVEAREDEHDRLFGVEARIQYSARYIQMHAGTFGQQRLFPWSRPGGRATVMGAAAPVALSRPGLLEMAHLEAQDCAQPQNLPLRGAAGFLGQQKQALLAWQRGRIGSHPERGPASWWWCVASLLLGPGAPTLPAVPTAYGRGRAPACAIHCTKPSHSAGRMYECI